MFMFLDLKKAFGVQNPKNIFFKIFLLEVGGDECQILNGLLLFFCYLPLFPMFMFLDLKKAFGVQNQKKKIFFKLLEVGGDEFQISDDFLLFFLLSANCFYSLCLCF